MKLRTQTPLCLNNRKDSEIWTWPPCAVFKTCSFPTQCREKAELQMYGLIRSHISTLPSSLVTDLGALTQINFVFPRVEWDLQGFYEIVLKMTGREHSEASICK
jgi:hypothetical protein